MNINVWNRKYDIDNDDLEEKISLVAEELGLLDHEVFSDLEDLKCQYDNLTVDELLDQVKKIYISK